MPSRRRRAAREVLLLVAAAGVAAGILQEVRTDPLPWRLPPAVWSLESGARWVEASRALELYEEPDVLFLDAREPEAFVAGHVPGALDTPPDHLRDLLGELTTWAEGQRLLVYGAADDPSPVDALLMELEDLGFGPLYVLVSGWEGWQGAGGAVETGPEGILAPSLMEEQAP